MTHTKQIISALLAVVLLLSLCACSGGGSSTPDSSSAQVLSGTEGVEPQTSPAPQVDAINQMISKMSVEEKVGQMFYALCPSVGGGDFVAQYHLGGCLLSGDFFDDKSADDVRATIRDIQSRTLVPLLFGVDEEGGTVVRVSYHQQLRESAFDSPKNYYQNGGWEAVEAAETEKAELLTSLGINVNNAPVCDITSNTESFIYDRSFSGDVDEVNTFVKKVVDIYKSKKARYGAQALSRLRRQHRHPRGHVLRRKVARRVPRQRFYPLHRGHKRGRRLRYGRAQHHGGR